jgi:hypothetical protein
MNLNMLKWGRQLIDMDKVFLAWTAGGKTLVASTSDYFWAFQVHYLYMSRVNKFNVYLAVFPWVSITRNYAAIL